MFVGCCAILWFYWERLKKPKTKIFISADCWLCVFDLITPSQLGLGIALISHRFDIYVDEHFKTRRRALRRMEIGRKIGRQNCTKEMEIVNLEIAYYDRKPMPIPQIQLPRKVIGFRRIIISYIDKNVIAFLHRFGQLFAFGPIHLNINTDNDRIAEFFLRNIWPMFEKNIHGMGLSATVLRRLRQFGPSILNDFPSLRVVTFYADDLFTEFPADDSAMASDEQAVVKWLFTSRSDNVPKVLGCSLDMEMDDGTLASRIEAFKAAFANASSPVNFIVAILFDWSSAAVDSVVPFDLNNELTHEQLTLKTEDDEYFLLVRCPIARDESKWTKWEKEAIGWEIYYQWNHIYIQIINEDQIGDGLLDANPGTSDQQQK